jgi:hypothetical protein
MHLFLRGEHDKLSAAALEVAEESGVWLFNRLSPTFLPAYQKFEFVVGDATLDLSIDEIGGLFRKLFRKQG